MQSHVARFLGCLRGVLRRGRGWKALCPCHADQNPSLSVGIGRKGEVIFNCNAGCERDRIMCRLDLRWRDLYPPPGASVEAGKREIKRKTMDLELCHEVYSDLVRQLSLSSEDRMALHRRGLPSLTINAFNYRTLSDVPVFVTERVRECWGRKLLEVPGIYLSSGSYYFRGPPGLLIPIRNSEGFIRAVQVRVGRPDMKYWFPAGTGTPVHVPLSSGIPQPVVWVTEGPLKADIASWRSDFPIVAVPSTASWEVVLPALRQWKVGCVRTAFDMDWLTKRPVARQLCAFEQELIRRGLEVKRAFWEPSEGKGLDDVLMAGGEVKLREIRGHGTETETVCMGGRAS